MPLIILKTSRVIRKNLNVTSEKLMHKSITAILLIFAFGCTPKKKEKEIIIIEEEVFSENTSYLEVGKLKLSEYGFSQSPLAELIPANNVISDEMNTPLFTNYALKKRFIYMPEGKVAIYNEKEVLQFPVGTVLIKNFYYKGAQLSAEKGRIIETRLLIYEEDGCGALPYIRNNEQTEVFLEITGGEQNVILLDKGTFNYSAPSMAQCKSCHEINGGIAPIGPSALQLNKTI
jgi:hypothetical protein